MSTTSLNPERPRALRTTGLLVLAMLALALTVLVNPLIPATAKQAEPALATTFQLELDGVVVGVFAGATGMGSENVVVEYRIIDGNGVEVTRKLPGPLRYNDIVLERGLTSSSFLWDWRVQVEEGDLAGARSDGSIVMLDGGLNVVARWDFTNAWPSKVIVPAAADGPTSTVLEAVTIVVDRIERVS